MQKGGTSLKQKRLPGVDFSCLWRESGEVLSRGSNRLTMILAIMVAVTPLPVYQAMNAVRSILVSRLPEWGRLFYGGFVLLIMFFTLFFTLPLLFGLLRMASEMEQGREASLQDVFGSFSDGRSYLGSLRVSFSLGWRILILCVAEVVATRFALSLPATRGVLLLLGALMVIGVFVLWYLFAARDFLRAYLTLRESDVPERMQPYARSLAVRYGLGAYPRVVLSLLTFGILLLADVLPRMLIAYFRLCNKLNEITTRSEEI